MKREVKLLFGWKSIAAHLGVSRSTAIRWASMDVNPMPVRKIGGSACAWTSRMDQWAQTAGRRIGAPSE